MSDCAVAVVKHPWANCAPSACKGRLTPCSPFGTGMHNFLVQKKPMMAERGRVLHVLHLLLDVGSFTSSNVGSQAVTALIRKPTTTQ